MDDQENSPVDNDDLSEFDIYSKTPPRTKILRKNRERNLRDRHSSDLTTVVKAKACISRRNTTGTFDEIFTRQEHSDDEAPKRTNKRHMKLLRGSERDLKLDIARAQAANVDFQSQGDCCLDYPKTPSYQIEGNRRFMSLVARTFPCSKKQILKKTVEFQLTDFDLEEFSQDLWNAEGFDKKVEFFLIMRSLLMLGEKNDVSDNAKRAMSKEETIWQNELKDLIWLELQAYHADKTPLEEDAYLCQARETVEPLLNDIRNYKFRRQPKKYTSQSSDSGVEEECIGCGSLWCGSCMEAQNDALKDIEKLLKRLEDAERLFPSSNSFAELYPLYRSPEIVGKVNVMCQWYNITKQQRLKLNILGRLMVLLESKQSDWPCFDVEDDSENPSDSNNSTSSTGSGNSEFFSSWDHYNITPFAYVLTHKDAKFSPFRRYIENILKTKALDKGLNFLEKLHNRILQKTKKTLELPKDQSLFERVTNLSEDELCRYGCWSPEYKELGLPSYRGMYIFLATIPLEVFNEYLLLRLEQKPTNPSALSIRQLMRELKLGLKKALRERELACSYIDAATSGTFLTTHDFEKKLSKFDDCVKKVFDDYLDYLRRWMLSQENFPKSLLEHTHAFAMEICDIYPELIQKVGKVYACTIGTILGNTAERLIKRIQASVATNLLNDVQGDVKQKLFSVCRQLQTIFIEEKETSVKSISFVRTHLKKAYVPKECIDYIKDGITKFQSIIPNCIKKLQTLFDIVHESNLEDGDKIALNNRIREIMMRIFQFGFEFFREVNSLSKGQHRPRFVADMGEFAYLWMSFVIDRCDRGRGIRPRWAHQGMEYLLSVVQPVNTAMFSNQEFEDLKTMIDKCISHLVGTTAPLTPDSGIHSISPRSSLEQMRGRSRGSSPSPRPTYKSQRSGQGSGSGSGPASRKVSAEQSPIADVTESICNLSLTQDKPGCSIKVDIDVKGHSEKFHAAVLKLETQLDKKLTEQNLIGKIVEEKTTNKNSVMRRLVNFSWQRGIKIGQGRFGKVYTAVNNNTGEMMAVKEIALQYNDIGTLKKIAEEMKILEGISHKNLIKSYGVEVHKDEMLIFMEYCSEGTLESLVADTEKGLSELLARRYTFQLVSGVACLHDHGIVHRDIKTANIFLTDGGNRLKIGDFGCAIKIKSNVTTPGELKGFVGTQAYMAPEVFTKNMSEGYGRAADVWSIGCVVIEMVSGLRPWAQFDSNVQIMFKVGMGQSPDPPDDMIDEGLEFLEMCFKHDPKERATTRELLRHDYISVLPDD
ncbi:mitogen-activated protein kinase kinase kinase 4 [Diorhabda carinulata]|uniref:mitogen-activated protein kinase kinase kinase 4 n=1 Tax=Diorhabda carinulata TaxID=1163345 RepID=UPI0025A1DDE5|nr:mitogen-activated protein kinase kinase kinase 4 [Diorhabda carinulata]